MDSETDVQNVLQFIGHKNKFRWLGIGERIVSFFLLLLKSLFQFLGGSGNPA